MHFLENVIWVLITISLKCLPKGTVESKSALVLLLAIPRVCVSAYHSFENNFFHLISFRRKWILTEPYPCYKVQDQRVLADHLQHCEYQNISATEVRARQFYRYNSHNAKCGDVWKKTHTYHDTAQWGMFSSWLVIQYAMLSHLSLDQTTTIGPFY